MELYAVCEAVTATSGDLAPARATAVVHCKDATGVPPMAAQVANTNSIVVFASQLVDCKKAVINSCYMNKRLVLGKESTSITDCDACALTTVIGQINKRVPSVHSLSCLLSWEKESLIFHFREILKIVLLDSTMADSCVHSSHQ